MTDGVDAPGLGETRHQLLDILKREGPSGVARLSEQVALNVETVRGHLATLEKQELVWRVGTRRHGRGRPEVLYGLAEGAERLFPRREAEVLKHLAEYLIRTGRSDVLRDGFDSYVAVRRDAALERLEGLHGLKRVEAAAEILTEMGFMAEVDEDGTSLSLRHCPLRRLVEVSRIPCRAEVSLVAELLEERPARTEYIPDGDPACSYRLDLPDRAGLPTGGDRA